MHTSPEFAADPFMHITMPAPGDFKVDFFIRERSSKTCACKGVNEAAAMDLKDAESEFFANLQMEFRGLHDL